MDMIRCHNCGELRKIAAAACVCGALLIAPPAIHHSDSRVAGSVAVLPGRLCVSWNDTYHDDPSGSVLDTAADGIHAAGTASAFLSGDPYDLEYRLGN